MAPDFLTFLPLRPRPIKEVPEVEWATGRIYRAAMHLLLAISRSTRECVADR
jgi:hypothetical protein